MVCDAGVTGDPAQSAPWRCPRDDIGPTRRWRVGDVELIGSSEGAVGVDAAGGLGIVGGVRARMAP
jgi:hypothetical protein